jgi:hypothetical protein
MKRMHHSWVGVLTILLIALMALALAPAASAKAEILSVTGTETATGFTADVVYTGGVAHARGGGTFVENGAGVLLDGVNTTELLVVFDPATGEGICNGTFVLDAGSSGTWVGTFAGTMTFPTAGNGGAFLYDIRVSGRGTSGDVTGMTFIARDVKSDASSSTADVTGKIIAPHGS